ncbi:hypothetical protein EVAR_35331_1 [Eumeta japonica]|uniref:Uncharacterized protein n=1 Tax=Eumeta variegata TaxID=151549 RepID=A0A4C1XHL1_EUMVA|nr:hypothetical protein EVAR_35331_1 [Eumeta japonica]
MPNKARTKAPRRCVRGAGPSRRGGRECDLQQPELSTYGTLLSRERCDEAIARGVSGNEPLRDVDETVRDDEDRRPAYEPGLRPSGRASESSSRRVLYDLVRRRPGAAARGLSRLRPPV